MATITITANTTLEFNTLLGYHYGVDVDAIFEHPLPLKYRVTASPKVNVRALPDVNSADIGDKLYLEVVSGVAEGGWLKLLNEPGWVSMAWLEELK